MIRFTDLNYHIWGLEFFYCCFGCLSVFSRLMVFRTTTTQNDLGFVLFVVYLTHLFFYPWLSVIITGINWRYLCTFIHPSTVSSFPSHQWLICRFKGVIGVTLKGETGQRSPNPTRRRYAFFFPGLASGPAMQSLKKQGIGQRIIQRRQWFGSGLELTVRHYPSRLDYSII